MYQNDGVFIYSVSKTKCNVFFLMCRAVLDSLNDDAGFTSVLPKSEVLKQIDTFLCT